MSILNSLKFIVSFPYTCAQAIFCILSMLGDTFHETMANLYIHVLKLELRFYEINPDILGTIFITCHTNLAFLVFCSKINEK